MSTFAEGSMDNPPSLKSFGGYNAGVAQLVVRQLTDPSYSRGFFDYNNAGVAQLVER